MKDCYGLPERMLAGPLQSTTGGSPYRLYNVDHFNGSYTRQSLYGNIPFIIAHNPSKLYNAGLLWLNASDTYVDLSTANISPSSPPSSSSALSHFISECGALEFVTFLGLSPLEITSAYAKMTGATPMPQRFALGYHHCRWDSDTQQAIVGISEKFHEHKIPCDCIWLDIEHTDQKKYFTWDPKAFPKPEEMLAELHRKGRSVVLISDPHIKVDTGYDIYNYAVKNGI